MSEDLKESLLRRVSRNTQVVAELKNSSAWNFVKEDFSEAKQRIDDTWALIDDPKKLMELRVSKLAITQILTLLDSYEHDLKVAGEQLSKVDDPEVYSKANYGEKS